MFKWPVSCGVACLLTLLSITSPAYATRIRDVARLHNEKQRELTGLGLIVGLKGTGDGGDSMVTMRPLREMLKKFDDPVLLDKELKNANNVALVSISVKIPAQGAHIGDKLDVHVSALAGAKSLEGGRLFITPLLVPLPDQKIILGRASGEVTLNDKNIPTVGVVKVGGILEMDMPPEEEIIDRFTLILQPQAANPETASTIADQINEDVSPQTDGKPVAKAQNGTAVEVLIPKAERDNVTAFVARIRSLPLPNIPGPAKVTINTKTKTIIFTEEVELAPTMISHGGLTITVTAPKQNSNPPGSQVPFIVLDAHRTGMAKLRDLEAAFNLLKVSSDDRIAIVKLLHSSNVLKCELEIE